MKRIIYLLPVVAFLMGVQSCCCDKDDDDSAPVAAPAIQPNGDYPVDLGLSVKWATCNVGATTPEEYGDYYAWGDTATYYATGYAREHPQAHWKEGKESGYNDDTYKFRNNFSHKLTKYCSKSSYGDEGYIDNDTTLLPVDDVAHYMWGGNWRMPTRAEFEELLDSCDWAWTDYNYADVHGWKVTSRKDSTKSIFLPTNGYRSETHLSGIHTSGYYWSSSLVTNNPRGAWGLYFYSSNSCCMKKYDRHNGFTVRPVCP